MQASGGINEPVTAVTPTIFLNDDTTGRLSPKDDITGRLSSSDDRITDRLSLDDDDRITDRLSLNDDATARSIDTLQESITSLREEFIDRSVEQQIVPLRAKRVGR